MVLIKCICIKESSWYLIDDSFDVKKDMKSGTFTFNVGEIYNYIETNEFFGKNFTVYFDNNIFVGHDEQRFFTYFKIE